MHEVTTTARQGAATVNNNDDNATLSQGVKRYRDPFLLRNLESASPSPSIASNESGRISRSMSHAHTGSLRPKDQLSGKGPVLRTKNDFEKYHDDGNNRNNTRHRSSVMSASSHSELDDIDNEDDDEEMIVSPATRNKRHRAALASRKDTVPPLPLLSRPALVNETSAQVTLTSSPLPAAMSLTDDAVDQDGAFTCDVDGCLVRITNARSQQGHLDIRDHYRTAHLDISRERLDLVAEESRRIGLETGTERPPVNKLADQIRMWAAKDRARAKAEGRKVNF
jgi:hypothetical protein